MLKKKHLAFAAVFFIGSGYKMRLPVKRHCQSSLSKLIVTQVHPSYFLSETPTNALMHGSYVETFLQFKIKKQLPSLERRKLCKQVSQQYELAKRNVTEQRCTKQFMRIVAAEKSIKLQTNRFDWVDSALLQRETDAGLRLLELVGISPGSNAQFEKKVQNERFKGRCDIYDEATDTVVEIKSVANLSRAHFEQAAAYRRILNASRCYLINTRDSSLWSIR